MTGRAFRNGLAPFALVAVLAGSQLLTAPAAAQNRSTEEENTAPEGINDADCAKIPGGNAPVNILARIEGHMAVENLEFTYFDKKLFQLTRQDFDYLKRLIPYCREQPTDQTNYIIDRLADLILEAQETRQKSIDWIEKTKDQLERMPANKDSIEEVHNIWTELQNRRLEMTDADARFLMAKIDATRDRLYREADIAAPGKVRQDPQLQISPFLPEIPSDERKPDPG
ncbi:hypothetical protein NUH88_06835 [Nisaea acidiphila]|uniref:Uncharacterized protein n=1 Tax=Nisaea acidiphila TaxID=1862145 RepID=A0A9J7AYR1_9PROT|nr:hypothetical protein [Nisaea acidiphila]UUX51404.1 hypothetical protein NUH88_06835 [Nisaea acidiphila]